MSLLVSKIICGTPGLSLSPKESLSAPANRQLSRQLRNDDFQKQQCIRRIDSEVKMRVNEEEHKRRREKHVEEECRKYWIEKNTNWLFKSEYAKQYKEKRELIRTENNHMLEKWKSQKSEDFMKRRHELLFGVWRERERDRRKRELEEKRSKSMEIVDRERREKLGPWCG